jgi:hypothetical protein
MAGFRPIFRRHIRGTFLTVHTPTQVKLILIFNFVYFFILKHFITNFHILFMFIQAIWRIGTFFCSSIFQ